MEKRRHGDGSEGQHESESGACKKPSIVREVNTQQQRCTPELSNPCGGVLTSRLPPIVSNIFQLDISNRLRIERTDRDEFPEFSGCQEWSFPLLFAEYEVRGDRILVRAAIKSLGGRLAPLRLRCVQYSPTSQTSSTSPFATHGL